MEWSNKALVTIATLGLIWSLCCHDWTAALAWSCATINAVGWADLSDNTEKILPSIF